MSETPEIYTEAQAQIFCALAIREGRTADLLNILSDGGAVTFDPIAMRLVFATAEMLNAIVSDP